MAKHPKTEPGIMPASEPNGESPALPAPRATSKNRVHPYFIAHEGPVSDDATWTVKELCAAYEWPMPNDVAGGGRIALIHLAGGWLQTDINQFFAAQGLPGLAPTPTDRSLDSDATNSKLQTPNEADAEVALDIQLASAAYAVATNKPATIVVYRTTDLTTGLVAATADNCDVCCITWGADEQTWGRAAADAFNAAAKAAVDSGMIIVAASGDNDSSDGGPTPSNVDFPASSPYVIGCGGTSSGEAAERRRGGEGGCAKKSASRGKGLERRARRPGRRRHGRRRLGILRHSRLAARNAAGGPAHRARRRRARGPGLGIPDRRRRAGSHRRRHERRRRALCRPLRRLRAEARFHPA